MPIKQTSDATLDLPSKTTGGTSTPAHTSAALEIDAVTKDRSGDYYAFSMDVDEDMSKTEQEILSDRAKRRAGIIAACESATVRWFVEQSTSMQHGWPVGHFGVILFPAAPGIRGFLRVPKPFIPTSSQLSIAQNDFTVEIEAPTALSNLVGELQFNLRTWNVWVANFPTDASPDNHRLSARSMSRQERDQLSEYVASGSAEALAFWKETEFLPHSFHESFRRNAEMVSAWSSIDVEPLLAQGMSAR